MVLPPILLSLQKDFRAEGAEHDVADLKLHPILGMSDSIYSLSAEKLPDFQSFQNFGNLILYSIFGRFSIKKHMLQFKSGKGIVFFKVVFGNR